MSKQTSNRNHRTKGFKVKQGLKIFILIALGIWLLYQLKHLYDKKSYEDLKASPETKTLGRKGFQPWINKPYELRDDSQEKEGERLKEQSSGGDDDIVGHGRDRVEEEDTEEVEDLIDEEDKEKEEQNEDEDGEDMGKQMEDMRLLDDQSHDEGEKDTLATSEEHFKEIGASRVVMQVTQSLGSEFEFGGLRNVKEDEVESSQKSRKEKQKKKVKDLKEVIVQTTHSSSKVVDNETVEHGLYPNVLQKGLDVA
ncbi:hypothetical protein VNO77_11039 [Canavalia gladiata]|uniref:Uncharacterized protein n=1 Tax=Canavalia gladiata TaxID=3824 RepID=A0AAN9MHM6_CANGL